jgi:cytoskeletal protein CcmA (bactofilin family)
LFWKKAEGTDNNSGEPDNKEIGLLGMDTRFKGHVRFKGTLRLDGDVDGTIVSEEGSGSILIVNQNAVVNGNITSDSVLISGRVRGNIKAMERVEIYRSGSLKGDVYTGDIMIEGGAEFEGNCRMIKNLNPEQREKLLKTAFSKGSGSGERGQAS